MVDYSKFRELGYYQLEPPDEYRRTYISDEFNKISFAIQALVNEYYPAKNARVVTASEAITVIDDVILASGDITITLYDAAGFTDPNGVKDNAGRRITIKNTGSGTIVIDGSGSQTIDGSTTVSISNQYNALELISDGSNWHIISEYPEGKFFTTGKALVLGF